MQGIITKVYQGTSQKTGKAYKVYTIDGQEYSSYEFLDFEEGQEIEFTFKKSGKWKNLVSAQLAGEVSTKDDIIIREVAIKAAVEGLKTVGSGLSLEEISRMTITIAEEFEAYIKGPEEGPEEEIPF